MGPYRKFKKRSRSNRMTEFEKFQWIVFCIICTVLFAFYLIKGFIFNCVFEWPIRWDVRVCWSEQINPAKEKAAEKATNFMP